ncbi:MAG: chromate transporter [Bacteroidaceae bacterium]|nr:chromate transporter [Bacteroidaceae bacterium]MBQ2518401.1 chromate transporter [Bacteroidaceae bacterium]
MILLFLRLFWTFFLIGLFGFGGGYAMISMIQGEIVTHYHWLTMGEFTDIVAISQSTPGPIGINSATYVGYTSIINAGYSHAWGVLGSFVASFAVVLPSFVLMILISKFLLKYYTHPAVENTFAGLRPAVVGLLAAAALLLMNAENFSSYAESPWQFSISVAIFAFAFISQRVYKMNPIHILLLCGLAGLILF